MAVKRSPGSIRTGRGRTKAAALPASAQFLRKTHKSVRPQFDGTSDIPTFLASVGTLTRANRERLIEQALVLLEDAYVHLPLKQAMHATDPIQRLKLLRHRPDDFPLAVDFHNEMTEIFTSVRDLHTNYLLPAPFDAMVAFLPFQVEAYFEAGERKYLVSNVMDGFNHATFGRGVEILHWNGIPIERAVAISGAKHAGSNAAARHARGVAGLTIRPLVRSLPPDAEWVVIGYRTEGGQELEFRQDWLIFPPPPDDDAVDPDSDSAEAAALGVDIEADTIRRAQKILFAPGAFAADQEVAAARLLVEHRQREQRRRERRRRESRIRRVRAREERERERRPREHRVREARVREARAREVHVREDHEREVREREEQEREMLRAAEASGAISLMPTVFAANPVETSHGTFGYIRIRSFNVKNADAFVREFVRLASLLPRNGLIVDVRDNGGGLISAGERLLQVLTPRRIEPERLQFLNTPLTLSLCRRHAPSQVLADFDLGPWVASIEQAVETGAVYSRGLPITSPESANAIGQKYHGPVILITNARCYSTTDIFAAGFQDHEIGPILGTDDNTGAGGANVWTHGLFRTLFEGPASPHDPLPSSPFKPLPNGANMRVAIRRTLRVGEQSGTPLEDLGVHSKNRHEMTRKDLLEGNADLIEHAASFLAPLPVYALSLSDPAVDGGTLTAVATTERLSRLDVFVNDRPRQSLDVVDGANSFSVAVPPAGSIALRLEGYDGDRLAAALREDL